MYRFVFVLFSCTVLVSTAAPAQAAIQHRLNSTKPSLPSRKPGPHLKSQAKPQARSQPKSQTENLKVSASQTARNGGGGMMRVETAPYAVQSVGKEYISMRSPTSTGLDLVANLPSISVATPDSSGIRAGALFMRGFTDSDIALLLNGAPASQASFLQQNALPEEIESVVITPGSSPTDAPATNASAGTLIENTITPSHTAGGTFDASFGTYGLKRQFLRLQSGDIGNTGIRAYIAAGHILSGQWNGAGKNKLRHIDFGAQKDFHNGSNIKLFVSWNNAINPIDNYADESQFLRYKHTGQGFNRSNTWDAHDLSTGNYWKTNLSSWNQFFVSASSHIVVTPKLSVDLMSYLSTGFGSDGSEGGTAGSNDQCPCYTRNGTPVAADARLSTYWAQQWSPNVGAVAKATYALDAHNTLSAGYWYGSNTVNWFLPTSLTQSNGRNPSLSQTDRYLYNANHQRVIYKFNSGNEVNSFFVEAKQSYLNKTLQMSEGFKFVMSNYWVNQSGLGKGHLGANTTAPLPHLSLTYHLTPSSQIYINAEGDFRQPSPDQIRPAAGIPRNQYSITEQIGYRYQNDILIFDASAFNSNITNRLLNTYLGSGAFGTVNAGNQTIRGFDVMLAGRSWHHLSPYASLEYLNGHFDSNIPYGTSYLPTKGLQSIMTPRVLANAGLTYDSKSFFGNVSLHYTGPQSVTLVNDQRMPGFVTNSIALGYRFKPMSYLKSPTFRMNFSNITGSVIRMGANGISTNQHNVTLVDGTPGPTANAGAIFLVQPNFSMVGTFSTDF